MLAQKKDWRNQLVRSENLSVRLSQHAMSVTQQYTLSLPHKNAARLLTL